MTLEFVIMPSQRKRIGFLPSEEVHEIIDKLCRANDFSQSKVTGILVEEALRSRGVLSDSFSSKTNDHENFFNDTFEKEIFSRSNKVPSNRDSYKLNKQLFSEEISIMHEFIEYKYFKKVMKQNKNIFE